MLSADVEWESPLLFRSLDEVNVPNPFVGPDVHGDDGHVAGERNFIFERELNVTGERVAESQRASKRPTSSTSPSSLDPIESDW